jgi:hypothetical protein
MRSTIEDGNLDMKLDSAIEGCECRVAVWNFQGCRWSRRVTIDYTDGFQTNFI